MKTFIKGAFLLSFVAPCCDLSISSVTPLSREENYTLPAAVTSSLGVLALALWGYGNTSPQLILCTTVMGGIITTFSILHTFQGCALATKSSWYCPVVSSISFSALNLLLFTFYAVQDMGINFINSIFRTQAGPWGLVICLGVISFIGFIWIFVEVMRGNDRKHFPSWIFILANFIPYPLIIAGMWKGANAKLISAMPELVITLLTVIFCSHLLILFNKTYGETAEGERPAEGPGMEEAAPLLVVTEGPGMAGGAAAQGWPSDEEEVAAAEGEGAEGGLSGDEASALLEEPGVAGGAAIQGLSLPAAVPEAMIKLGAEIVLLKLAIKEKLYQLDNCVIGDGVIGWGWGRVRTYGNFALLKTGIGFPIGAVGEDYDNRYNRVAGLQEASKLLNGSVITKADFIKLALVWRSDNDFPYDFGTYDLLQKNKCYIHQTEIEQKTTSTWIIQRIERIRNQISELADDTEIPLCNAEVIAKVAEQRGKHGIPEVTAGSVDKEISEIARRQTRSFITQAVRLHAQVVVASGSLIEPIVLASRLPQVAGGDAALVEGDQADMAGEGLEGLL